MRGENIPQERKEAAWRLYVRGWGATRIERLTGTSISAIERWITDEKWGVDRASRARGYHDLQEGAASPKINVRKALAWLDRREAQELTLKLMRDTRRMERVVVKQRVTPRGIVLYNRGG